MPFLFNVRFSRDAALVDPLRDLADRVAQYAGYRATEAQQIGATVGSTTAAAFAELAATADDLEIQFHTSDTTFDVTLVIDGTLARSPAPFTCVQEGSRTVCRLTRKLPDTLAG
jgi:hypothetical protein